PQRPTERRRRSERRRALGSERVRSHARKPRDLSRRCDEHGNKTAHDVSVVVTIPATMVVTSATREPTIRDGRVTWVLDSVPIGTTVLSFTATLPPANDLQQVDAAVAATYGNASGGQVRLANVPTSLVVLP